MCSCDKEMMSPGWTTPMSHIQRISPSDLVLIEEILDELDRIEEMWTYDFNITSDSVPQWEETHS